MFTVTRNPNDAQLVGAQTVTLTASGAVTFSVVRGVGELAVVSGTVATFAAVNQTQNVVIRATDGVDTVDTVISFMGLFPLQPNYGLQWEDKRDSVVSRKRGGELNVFPISDPYLETTYGFQNRTFEEYDALRDFWAAHVNESFFVDDLAARRTYYAKFNSGIRTTGVSHDDYSFEVALYSSRWTTYLGGYGVGPYGAGYGG